MKLKLAECVALNQEAVVRYNASKVKPAATSKSTDSLVRELLSAKKRPNPEDWVLLSNPFVRALSPKTIKSIKHAYLEQLQLAEHARQTKPEDPKKPKIIENAHISWL